MNNTIMNNTIMNNMIAYKAIMDKWDFNHSLIINHIIHYSLFINLNYSLLVD